MRFRMPELVCGRELWYMFVGDSGVSFELAVGHLVEVSYCCEEVDVAVCDPVVGSCFAFVHLFKLFSVVLEGF